MSLGIERLPGRRHMLHRREIVFRDVLLDHHAQHRRRRAERRDMMLCEHRQDLRGVEPVEIVNEDRALAQPLAVKFPPRRLGPAGVGDRKKQSFGIHRLPVLGLWNCPSGYL